MDDKLQEIEAKFVLSDLKAFEKRLEKTGAILKHPRVFEINIRFDNADGTLMKTQQVLRLRKDERVRLTYKSPSQALQPVSIRKEIELEVNDFEKSRLFLESIGFHSVVCYEKWRTTYQMGAVEIVLDELPFGHFCELEGPDAPVIEKIANRLGLNWGARCTLSYLALFSQFKAARNLDLHNLTFSEFERITADPSDLGLSPADR